ncbi:MAG: hypothetical protein PW843_16140 [Azospirillaceae bacterium]|nr:hypothetical protein [Azospirillaceae bacterium]
MELSPKMPFPDHETLMGQAYDALGAGDEAAAERALSAVVAGWPDDAESRGQLGALLRRQGRAAEATPHFAQAARLEPGRALWVVEQAACLEEAGHGDAAWVLVAAALGQRADDAGLHRLAARLLLARGDTEKALAHAREARFLAPGDLEGAVAGGPGAGGCRRSAGGRRDAGAAAGPRPSGRSGLGPRPGAAGPGLGRAGGGGKGRPLLAPGAGG